MKLKDIQKITKLSTKTIRWLYSNIFHPNEIKQDKKNRLFNEENLKWIQEHQLGVFDIKNNLKLIPGCEYTYASPEGKIYHYKRGFFEERIQYLESFGYYSIKINEKSAPSTKRVHRLIAMTFIPNLNNLPVVNHIDGNKLNNNINNLEWTTIQDNTKKAYDMNLLIPYKLDTSKKVNLYNQNNELIVTCESLVNAADFLKISKYKVYYAFRKKNGFIKEKNITIKTIY